MTLINLENLCESQHSAKTKAHKLLICRLLKLFTIDVCTTYGNRTIFITDYASVRLYVQIKRDYTNDAFFTNLSYFTVVLGAGIEPARL